MKKNALLVVVIPFLLLFGACRPPRSSAGLAAGVAAAKADNWEEAVRHWQDVIAREPGSAAAHNNLAVACEKRGAWEEARKEYEAALVLDPSNLLIKDNFERFKARQNAAQADRDRDGQDRSPFGSGRRLP